MEARSHQRQRRGLVLALVVLATVLAFLAVFAIWANRQTLETDTWTDTSTELLEDEDVRVAVSGFLVDTLYANVDVAGELRSALPTQAQALAGPAAAGLRELANEAANEALQRPRVQELWEEANRSAHETFVDVVEHGSDEPVTLDLRTIVEQLGARAGIDVAGKLPPDAGRMEVLTKDNVSFVQDVVRILRGLAIVLILLALAVYGVAIYLARGWRREALRSCGFGLLVAGILVLIARGLTGNAVVDSLSATASSDSAVESTWEIGTSLLAAQGGATIFYGLIIVIGAWLAGPGGVARDARGAIAPFLERRAIAYSLMGLILLLLFWWSPTPAFDRLPTSLLLIALIAVGVEALRAQTVRDFPEQTWEAASARWQHGLYQRRDRG